MVRVVEERDGHLIWVDSIGRGTHVPGTRAGDTCMEKLDTHAMMPLNAELKGIGFVATLCLFLIFHYIS